MLQSLKPFFFGGPIAGHFFMEKDTFLILKEQKKSWKGEAASCLGGGASKSPNNGRKEEMPFLVSLWNIDDSRIPPAKCYVIIYIYIYKGQVRCWCGIRKCSIAGTQFAETPSLHRFIWPYIIKSAVFYMRRLRHWPAPPLESCSSQVVPAWKFFHLLFFHKILLIYTVASPFEIFHFFSLPEISGRLIHKHRLCFLPLISLLLRV